MKYLLILEKKTLQRSEDKISLSKHSLRLFVYKMTILVIHINMVSGHPLMTKVFSMYEDYT